MTGSTNEVWTLDSLLDCVVPDMHREQVLALVAEAYDAGHAAYMQQRRAEIAASLAEPGVADTEQALRARQDAILAEVRAQAHAAGVAEGRRQAAEEIRAGMLSGIRLPPGLPGYRYDGTRPPVSVYAEWAAQIAAGE